MAGDPGTICFTVDVEWAHPAVLQDVRVLFDMHGVRATFFCTHAGVDVDRMSAAFTPIIGATEPH
jgi:hypothetical protein